MFTPTFPQPSENTPSWHHGDHTCTSPANNYPHKSSIPQQSKRAVKQLIRYLKGTHNTCLRLEPRMTSLQGLLELVGRSDSDWAGDSPTGQSATGYHCNVQGETTCNRSLKRTANRLSSCEAEFYSASACAGELLGLAELFNELHYDVSVRLEMDSNSARHILQRRRPGGLEHIEIRCMAIQQWTGEKTSIGGTREHGRQHCRSLHETSG